MKNYIPQEIVQEIKGRADILEVISDHVSLRKAGRSFKGLCPFHTEKTPSFTVSPEKGIFYCFGCGTGGDVFQFVMKRDNLSFAEAISSLADRYGLSSLLHARDQKGTTERSQNQRLLALVEAAGEFFQRSLVGSPAGEKARKYLKERAILPETAERFRLGYAPLSADSLLRHLGSLGFSMESMKEAGLLKEGERGRYCWLRERLVFPLFDHRGRAIGFGGRLLGNGEKGKYPKYINSPEGPLYKKGEHFYGLHLAKEPIRQEGTVLVVEGYFDLITLVQDGIGNVVASLGTAVTKEHLRLLRRWTTRVTLVFDGDTAGMAAVERMAGPFLESGLKPSVLALPAGDDPDTLLRREGREAFLSRLEGAVPYVEHSINRAVAGRDCSQIEGRLECIQEVLPILAKVPNQVEQMFYLSLLAERTQSFETALLSELKKLSSGRRRNVGSTSFQTNVSPPQKPISQGLFKPNKVYSAERELIQLMLQDRSFIEKLKDLLPVENFQDADLREIARSLYETFCDGVEGVSFETLPTERQRDLASKLLQERKEYEEGEVDKLIHDCLRVIVIEDRKRTKPRIEELTSEYQRAIAEERYDDFVELQRRFLEMIRQEKK